MDKVKELAKVLVKTKKNSSIVKKKDYTPIISERVRGTFYGGGWPT